MYYTTHYHFLSITHKKDVREMRVHKYVNVTTDTTVINKTSHKLSILSSSFMIAAYLPVSCQSIFNSFLSQLLPLQHMNDYEWVGFRLRYFVVIDVSCCSLRVRFNRLSRAYYFKLKVERWKKKLANLMLSISIVLFPHVLWNLWRM